MNLQKTLIALAFMAACSGSAAGQTLAIPSLTAAEEPVFSVADSLLAASDSLGLCSLMADELPAVMFLPAVYTGYDRTLPSTEELFAEPVERDPAMPEWLSRAMRTRRYANRLMQTHAINAPWQLPYNIATMAEPPKKYVAKADPITAATIFEEIGAVPGAVVLDKPAALEASEVKKQHWLNKFNTMLQFSQAFVSPNWYQGGNNSLNLMADFTYQSNLNTKFHPKLLFENFFQWRTSLTSTPDDEYRPYSLTDNLFQVNSKFGYKAIYNWYYSVQALLKTPVFRGYKSSSMTRTASFMSPGEFNLGIGMTYNLTTKNKKFSLSLSISPLSYNLKTVIDPEIDEVAQGLEEGHKTLNAVGSNLEANWDWKICYNVAWKSRVFFFTDYERYQYDWENKFIFTINRFLTANLNVDLRYDSTMHKTTYWYKTQLRETFSLGFTYTLNH